MGAFSCAYAARVTEHAPGPSCGLARSEHDLGTLRVVIESPSRPDDLVRAAVERGEAEPDYWAHVWPAGRALASFVARSGLVGPGVRALEVCAGAGLAGVAAALRGAETLITDASPDAVELIRRNIALNGAESASAAALDIRDGPPEGFAPDLILAADAMYSPALHSPLAALVRGTGATALIADPLRPQAAMAHAAFESAGLRVWSAPLGDRARLYTVGPG